MGFLKKIKKSVGSSAPSNGRSYYTLSSDCKWLCKHLRVERENLLETRRDVIEYYAERGCPCCQFICDLVTSTLNAVYEFPVTLRNLLSEIKIQLNEQMSVRSIQSIFNISTMVRTFDIEFYAEEQSNHAGHGKASWLSSPAFHDVMEVNVAPKYVEESPSSDRSIETIRRWISECDAKHICPRIEGGRPRRVLAVDSDVIAEKVRLVETSRFGEDGKLQYIALSYCWGKQTQRMTTRATYAAHKSGIDVEDLPLSHQNTVWLARRLGISYIWIDALCIVQDDEEDRTVDIGKMHEVYSGAYLVLIAASGNSSNSGFLGTRSASVWQALSDLGRPGVFARHHIPHRNDFCLGQPTNQRAWCVQERTLARRCLIFTDREISWECRGFRQCECTGNLAGHTERWETPLHQQLFFYRKRGESTSEALSQYKDMTKTRMCEIWYTFVQEFSKRRMTDSLDRLPACGAVANSYSEFFKDNYLAGLWQEDIIRGLIWKGRYDSALDSPNRPYIAPSWSWASFPGIITFYCIESKISAHRGPCGRMIAQWTGGYCQATPTAPFGKVSEGLLLLKSYYIDTTMIGQASELTTGDMEKLDHGEFTNTLQDWLIEMPNDSRREIKFSIESSPADSLPLQEVPWTNAEGQVVKTLQRIPGEPAFGLPRVQGEVRLLWLTNIYCLVLTPSLTYRDAYERIGILSMSENYHRLDRTYGEICIV